MIIDFHHLPHYHNILRIKQLTKLKTTIILNLIEKDILFAYHS